MSWKDILKYKERVMPIYKEMIDSIMTDTPIIPRDLVSNLYDEIDRVNASRNKRNLISNKQMPTPSEVSNYLKKDERYASINIKGRRHYYKL